MKTIQLKALNVLSGKSISSKSKKRVIKAVWFCSQSGIDLVVILVMPIK